MRPILTPLFCLLSAGASAGEPVPAPSAETSLAELSAAVEALLLSGIC